MRRSIAISVPQPGARTSSGFDFSRSCGRLPALGRPVLDRHAGDGGDIIAGLARHVAGAVEPFANAARTGVIGRGGKPEIAELLPQLLQEFRRFRQRLDRVKRIEKSALGRRPRHELRHALRAMAAAGHRPDRVGAEAAFLPDHARKELHRQAVIARGGFDHQADRIVADCGAGRRQKRAARQPAVSTGPQPGFEPSSVPVPHAWSCDDGFFIDVPLR